MKFLKYYKVLLLCLSVSVVIYLAFLFYQNRISISQDVTQEVPHQPYPKPRVQIQGFQFTGTYEGKKSITINAEEFTIEKKKIGFFRFGLINIAKLKNATIDIYGESTKNGGIPIPKASHQIADRSNPKTQSIQGLTFKNIFRKESLPSFSAKRFSSIVIEPVCFRLRDANSLITQITATSATISMKNRNILFRRNVRAISGSSVLEADRVNLILENAILIADSHFVLNTPEKRSEGENIRTDIFLNIVRY